MNFGKYILLSFILFACFMAVLVTVCVREEVGLVSKNYYSEELVHQQKMDQAKNASGLTAQPKISIVGNFVKVDFQGVGKIEKGELILLRPSDSSKDQKFEIAGEESQTFPLTKTQKGLYRASLKWSMGNKEYYVEKLIEL